LASGFRLHGWWPVGKAGEPVKGDGGVHILGAVLGLLALILGFSFSVALDRFDSRRLLVLDEANAIRTAYLRSQILQGPNRDALSGILREYVDVRLAYFQAGGDAEKQAAIRTHTDALHDRLWAAAVTAVRPILDQDFSTQLVESMNQVIDLASARRAAFGQHIPASVLEILIIYALISNAMLGYMLADSGRRHLVTSSVLSVLPALVITLIMDIDRPNQGAVNVSINPLLDVREKIAAAYDGGGVTQPETVSNLPTDIKYTCAGGVSVRAVFAADFRSVTVTLPDRTIDMTQAIAASGIRYMGSNYTFWSKGNTAYVMRGEAIVIPSCHKL